MMKYSRVLYAYIYIYMVVCWSMAIVYISKNILDSPSPHKFFIHNFFFRKYFFGKYFWDKCTWGPEAQKKWRGRFWGVWGAPRPPPEGRAGSENDTLLPLTHDQPKFWNGPPCLSKVIVRKPWRRKNKKQEKNKIKSDKTIRHASYRNAPVLL